MKKAVFLDRDGVINKEIGEYVFKKDQFEFNQGLDKFIKIVAEKGYLIIVITNQGGVAKGIYTLADVENLNVYLYDYFKINGINITEIYACPHHPDFGKCLCRKPDSLMLEKSISRFDIDPSKSYFIGDSERDIIAGKKAGIRTIKIESNSNLLDIIDQII